MTPESRAKGLLAEIVQRGTGGWRFAAEMEECLPLIATAIRSAEDDKLEEAAGHFDRREELHLPALPDAYYADFIRSLKSP